MGEYGKNDFPLKDTYYLCTYLKWPYPENIDLEARIKKRNIIIYYTRCK